MHFKLILLLALSAGSLASAQTFQSKPAEPAFEKFQPLQAPTAPRLLLKRGDRLAICGDSITEQKMYSRLMEDYLTMCVPELQVTVRQYGWSGERAPGFLGRMTNDCLRFQPTVATTCYGMNDHEYRPYEERIGRTYHEKSKAIVEAFKAHGARVVLGSPGCVGKMPSWVKSASGTVEDLNLNLCVLRNLGIGMAREEKVGFADVFWPMLTAGVAAQKAYGTNFAIAGKDGVHPGWAGHTVMAYAFLSALGLDGDIGTFTVDLRRNRMKVSAGHRLVSAASGEYVVCSSKYPFCPCLEEGSAAAGYPLCGKDDLSSDASIRAGMALVPFNAQQNRLMLVGKRAQAAGYQVTWGGQTKLFSSEQLARGVNLAEEFPCNPFSAAFAKVDAAVAAKQAYETKQIKQVFHAREPKGDMETRVLQTEQERAPLAAAIRAAFVPVTHTLRVVPR